MCLGPYLFSKAVVLRDSMLVGTLLSCSEVWYGVTEDDLSRLEQADKGFWCSLVEIARTVPYELVCLELGVLPLRFIIMRRRLVYLQHVLKENETSLIKSFLITQMKSLKRKDWGKTVLENLKYLEIKNTFEEIKEMSEKKYKEIIKLKILEKAFCYLIQKNTKRNGKGKNIRYNTLRMQNYLCSEDENITNEERKFIFQLRTKIDFKIKSHFRKMHIDIICDGCRIEVSTTRHTLECVNLIGKNELITYLPNYSDLYGEDEDDQVYLARIVRDNLKRVPAAVGPCEPVCY